MQNFHPESLERACRLEYAFSHIIIEMTHLLGQTQPDRDVLSGRKITSGQVGAITEAPRGTQDPASGSRMYTVAIVECAKLVLGSPNTKVEVSSYEAAVTDTKFKEITKLKDEMGDKTVAVDAFEGNNLVLVDEGHRGAAGFEWMDKRNRLCEEGFSFEYSATFGQAI